MNTFLHAAVALGLALPAHSAVPTDPTGFELDAFQTYLGQHPDLTAAELLAMAPEPTFLDEVTLDPEKAKNFDRITATWPLGPDPLARLRQNGFVAFDAGQRYTMASLYQHAYMEDLPVLITTDSILHAMHASLDKVLMRLEEEAFLPVMRDVLMKARDALVASKAVDESARDAELYLTVALNLMRGAARQDDDAWSGPWDGKVDVVSALGQDEAVLAILKRVQGLQLEQKPETEIYGGKRAVDWSQFTPRGHYSKSPDLSAYFRAMMWLGRPDTGFNITEKPAGSEVDPDRERRAAGRLVLAIKAKGGDARLREVDALLTFLVGESDNLGIDPLGGLMAQAGMKAAADVVNVQKDAALKQQLEATGLAAQRVRSQWLLSNPEDPKVENPALFQVFGQRFLIDSFVLSQLVYDSIGFKGVKQQRMMPTGLDVMAAFGNDTALHLLRPELEKWNYSNNLAAARTLVKAYPATTWNATAYGRWLDALGSLDALPADRTRFPQAMQTRAWAHKQLQTQLGSWSELRHDFILYGKQSYSAMAGCEYPSAFVEPYPEFYRKLASLAQVIGAQLAKTKLQAPGRDELANLLAGQVNYFKTLQGHLGRLAGIADLELAGKPLSGADTAWLKKTADIRGGGSGPPTYDGWYCELFYGVAPNEWAPTIADVHTDPNSRSVLEVAVGDARPMVLIVDNDNDRQAYVGPTYSYYEFASPEGRRLTDAEWQQRIYDGNLPPQSPWISAFTAPQPAK